MTDHPSTSKKRSSVHLPCNVCKEPGDGLHFGAEACRACAAFFRRSIALEKNYSCRAEGVCEVSSTVRNFCRACRLNKCLFVGMKKYSVQRYRENNPIFEDLECPSPNPETEMVNLNKLKLNYLRLDEVRRRIHSRECENIFNKPNARPVNYREASYINVKEVGILADFIINSFPQLKELPLEQQKLLYMRFFLHFLLLESGYHCSAINRSDIIILSTGDFIDTTRPYTFYNDEEHSTLVTGKDACKTLSPSFDLFRRNLLEPMKTLAVDEIEFLALCSFAFWDYGIPGQTPECETLAEHVRKDVTRELIFYYKHMKKITEPAERLSGILILLTPLQRAVQRFKQDVEISHFFNYDFDDTFYKIVNGRL